MGWIGCVRCENFRRDFVARTFALIAPVQPILHRVSCGNEILPNAHKHYEMHQNMSLGSNGVDWADLLQKNLTQLCGSNSSACFEPSIVKQRNGPKCTQTQQNAEKHGVDSVDLLQKFLTQLCGLNFCINYNSSARFEPSIVKQRNGPKCTQTLRSKIKHDFRVQRDGLGAFVVKNRETTS
jgi:hypothetical protein